MINFYAVRYTPADPSRLPMFWNEADEVWQWLNPTVCHSRAEAAETIARIDKTGLTGKVEVVWLVPTAVG